MKSRMTVAAILVTTLALVAAVPTFLKYDAKHPVP